MTKHYKPDSFNAQPTTIRFDAYIIRELEAMAIRDNTTVSRIVNFVVRTRLGKESYCLHRIEELRHEVAGYNLWIDEIRSKEKEKRMRSTQRPLGDDDDGR